ncbi:NAD+ synthase [Humisphaera borealis]|uniref:Glutamine-dependent NAD(+) synthetase n=1 Tax=Humisphaera borealis TaxID=2807512 RepID=A0A7M2WT62_9BACT|nr:NAD+ synthase [Humisphaera borealis]QOV88715.1 NAD+ synthase [Humisphaera borealis]
MRIALCQINPTVGDIAGNLTKHLEFIAAARKAGAELAVFPELSLLGYPPKDLLLKRSFVDDSLAALEELAGQTRGLDVIVGYADRNANPVGRPLHNAVALLRDGQVASRHFKTLLPTYDVFDESRYFEPGRRDERENLVEVTSAEGRHIIGMSICEDLWNDEQLIARRLYHENPIADLMSVGAELLVNASASPFVLGKHAFRLELFAAQARRFGKPIVYVNQVGGNDELVFDGNSVVIDGSGKLIATGKAFGEDLLIAEVGIPKLLKPTEPIGMPADYPPPLSAMPAASAYAGERTDMRADRMLSAPDSYEEADLEAVFKALVLGLRDYVHKTGFKSVVLGLSGGIDSALTAALAAEAFGPEKVVGVAMPSKFSSDHSIGDARDLAKNLGLNFHTIPIKDVHAAFESTLAGVFKGLAPDVTEENLQARSRGVILMAISNKLNHLLLTTGNKSELAVGYCTLYGDMCGGLAVISDVPKTLVWELSRYYNRSKGREMIPQSSIDKVPSAELRPNQTDQDSLPPYEVLDGILFRYVEEEKGPRQIIAEGFDEATVNRMIRLIDRSEYKRRQAAPGLKVTSRAFGFGRRMPIAQRYSP